VGRTQLQQRNRLHFPRGADGAVGLVGRGTKLGGGTRGEVRAGQERLFVLWSEARTPSGVNVDLASPGTDELGRAGVTGVVEWILEKVPPRGFGRDLGAKNWVLLLHDADGKLAGFSTILFYETELDGERVSVVYSGDTIVDPSHWGSPALARSWIASILELQSGAATSRIFWLLLTSGFRTYRFLPLFWRSFHPRPDAETPPETARRIGTLAGELLGDEYEPATGIVRFREPARLRPHLRELPVGRLHDPHVAFFLARNPGHAEGDELVCLTEISTANLTRAGWRMVSGVVAPDAAGTGQRRA